MTLTNCLGSRLVLGMWPDSINKGGGGVSSLLVLLNISVDHSTLKKDSSLPPWEGLHSTIFMMGGRGTDGGSK